MFTRVLYTFQRQLPLAEEPDLVGAVEELYERSVGCVGVLKGWLTQALAAALAEEAPTVTRQMLDRSGLPLANVLRMAREIAEGEALVRDSSGNHQELRSLQACAYAQIMSIFLLLASRASITHTYRPACFVTTAQR